MNPPPRGGSRPTKFAGKMCRGCDRHIGLRDGRRHRWEQHRGGGKRFTVVWPRQLGPETKFPTRPLRAYKDASRLNCSASKVFATHSSAPATMQLHHWIPLVVALTPSLASAALFPSDTVHETDTICQQTRESTCDRSGAEEDTDSQIEHMSWVPESQEISDA